MNKTLSALFATAFHGLADAVGTISASSAIDTDTKNTIAKSIATVKQSAGQIGEAAESDVEQVAKAAPADVGALAATGVVAAGASVPGVGGVLSSIFAPIVSAAVSLAVSHFEASFESHNKDHLAAADATIKALAASAPNAAGAAAVTANAAALQPPSPASEDLPA